jgi:hypothetical protein
MLRAREGDVEHGVEIDPKRDKITFDEGAQDLLLDYRMNAKRSLAVCERRVRKHLTPTSAGGDWHVSTRATFGRSSPNGKRT